MPGFRLDGEIPVQLGSLNGLEELNLSFNQLIGEVPSELGDLRNLVVLSMLVNRLSGQIPPELGNLSNLVELHLDDNQLTGTIPVELARLSKLEELSLWMNQLSGQIPPELGDLSNLRILFLAPNNLTGCIPVALQDVPINDFSALGLPFCGDSDAQETAISSIFSAKSAVPMAVDTPEESNTLKLLGLGDEETLLDAVALCEDIGALAQLASEHDGHKLNRHDWTDGDLDICQTLENRR